MISYLVCICIPFREAVSLLLDLKNGFENDQIEK